MVGKSHQNAPVTPLTYIFYENTTRFGETFHAPWPDICAVSSPVGMLSALGSEHHNLPLAPDPCPPGKGMGQDEDYGKKKKLWQKFGANSMIIANDKKSE